MTTLNPYISFRDNARAALEYYHDVLGGTLDISTFDSMPGSGYDPGDSDLVMHGSVTTDDGMVLMASDTPSSVEYAPARGISLSVGGDDADRLRTIWQGLLDGGSATIPLDRAPWGGEFGMLVDRFGIAWMVSIDS